VRATYPASHTLHNPHKVRRPKPAACTDFLTPRRYDDTVSQHPRYEAPLPGSSAEIATFEGEHIANLERDSFLCREARRKRVVGSWTGWAVGIVRGSKAGELDKVAAGVNTISRPGASVCGSVEDAFWKVRGAMGREVVRFLEDVAGQESVIK
jgi:hypothetical protein